MGVALRAARPEPPRFELTVGRARLRLEGGDPGAERHYGKRNAMPSYKDRMSQKDFDILLRWMRHRWYEPEAAEKLETKQ